MKPLFKIGDTILIRPIEDLRHIADTDDLLYFAPPMLKYCSTTIKVTNILEEEDHYEYKDSNGWWWLTEWLICKTPNNNLFDIGDL